MQPHVIPSNGDIRSLGHEPVVYIFVQTPCCNAGSQLLVRFHKPLVVERICEPCGRVWKVGAAVNRRGTFDALWRQQRVPGRPWTEASAA